MLSDTQTKILRWATLVVLVLMILAVFRSSSSFQACIGDQTKTASEYAEENVPIFSFALIYFKCSGHTLYVYRDAVTAAATIFIAIFTATLWYSTHRLWVAGENQRGLSEKTSERQLRAYLVVEKCDLQYSGGKPVVTVRVRNCGQTPAENVIIVGTVDVIQRQTTFVVASFTENISKGRVGPNLCVTLKLDKKPPLTQIEIDGLKGRTHWVVAAGDVEYTDIFKNTWRLPYEFCTGGKYGKPIRKGPMSVSTTAKIENKKNTA